MPTHGLVLAEPNLGSGFKQIERMSHTLLLLDEFGLSAYPK